MKTVCIDARLYGIAHTGIGRYTENLIRYLPSDPRTRVIIITSPESAVSPDLLRFTTVTARYHPYSVLAQLEMVGLWLRYRPDLLHATHSSIPALWPGRLVVTFHDLIRHRSKGKGTTTRKYFLYWLKYAGYLLVDRIAMWRAAKIIVPARYWKDILVKDYRIDPSRIAVTYEGVDSRIAANKKTGRGFGIRRPYVVYTGNLYPHKNVPVLLRAIRLLKGRVRLALVGARSVFTARAERLVSEYGISSLVTLLGRLSDAQLAGLYSSASAFVFPSLIEGFGLTGLEAMSSGLPVIAARASCLPEIYGQAALYFEPHDAAGLARQITAIISDAGLRRRQITRGQAQVQKYSWAKMSKQTWQIYQSVLH